MGSASLLYSSFSVCRRQRKNRALRLTPNVNHIVFIDICSSRTGYRNKVISCNVKIKSVCVRVVISYHQVSTV